MTSYLLKTGHRASFLLEFAEKHVAAGPSGKFLVVHGATKNFFFQVEVVIKNELYHVKKSPFKCSKIIIYLITFCRHTSDLESFNSMLTKYAPKRMAFE